MDQRGNGRKHPNQRMNLPVSSGRRKLNLGGVVEIFMSDMMYIDMWYLQL